MSAAASERAAAAYRIGLGRPTARSPMGSIGAPCLEHPFSLVLCRRRAPWRKEGQRQAKDAERQVQEVVEDRVAVGDEPEHHGYQEAQDADQEIDDPQC